MLKNKFIILPICALLSFCTSNASKLNLSNNPTNNSSQTWQYNNHKLAAKVDDPSCKVVTSPVSLCFNGVCPTGTPNSNYLIDHDIYVLSSNVTTKFADWVSYKVVESNLDGSNNSRVWKTDPCIAQGDTLSADDYKGAFKACGYDRGHQAPLGDFTNSPFAANANYLSNITPQEAKLNQGGWERLEKAERNLSKTYKDIYVLTGPYYDKNNKMCPLPAASVEVVIPSGYWKVIVAMDDSTKEHTYVAFLFGQQSHSKNYCNYITDLSYIQKITKLQLFPHYNRFVNPHKLLKALKC